jgi:hypothetical protein
MLLINPNNKIIRKIVSSVNLYIVESVSSSLYTIPCPARLPMQPCPASLRRPRGTCGPATPASRSAWWTPVRGRGGACAWAACGVASEARMRWTPVRGGGERARGLSACVREGGRGLEGPAPARHARHDHIQGLCGGRRCAVVGRAWVRARVRAAEVHTEVLNHTPVGRPRRHRLHAPRPAAQRGHRERLERNHRHVGVAGSRGPGVQLWGGDMPSTPSVARGYLGL